MRRGFLLGALLLTAGGAVAMTNAQIRCAVIGAGGGTATSPSHSMVSVVGAPVVGTSTSANHKITSWGFPCPASVATAVGDPGEAPLALRLHPPSPNPFNPRTLLRFDVPPAAGSIALQIYDLQGRLVRVLVQGPRPPGTLEAIWNGRDDIGRAVASGVYVARLSAGTQILHRKMTLLK